MKHPNILLWGNNTFHLVDSWNEKKLSAKYITIGICGTVESFTILTYEEVMTMTDNKAKPVKNLLDIHTVYHQRD
jgi:hypothetical protein